MIDFLKLSKWAILGTGESMCNYISPFPIPFLIPFPEWHNRRRRVHLYRLRLRDFFMPKAADASRANRSRLMVLRRANGDF